MTRRIGPGMLAAAAYVASSPGCPKLPVARAVGPNGSTRFGYAIVDRAISAGLIEHRPTCVPGAWPYCLHITERGEQILAEPRK
jgi:hypothetical protein